MTPHPYDRCPLDQIEVRDLRKGDILWPTGRTVTAAPTRGARTPRGKVDLSLDGRKVTFGAYTTVSIEAREGVKAEPTAFLACRDTVDVPAGPPKRRARRDRLQRDAARRRGER